MLSYHISTTPAIWPMFTKPALLAWMLGYHDAQGHRCPSWKPMRVARCMTVRHPGPENRARRRRHWAVPCWVWQYASLPGRCLDQITREQGAEPIRGSPPWPPRLLRDSEQHTTARAASRWTCALDLAMSPYNAKCHLTRDGSTWLLP